MAKDKLDITTAAGRRALPKRVDLYYRREGEGFVGFRVTGPDGEGIWGGRRSKPGGGYTYTSFGRLPDYAAAVRALNEWLSETAQAEKAGVSVLALNMTVADAARYYIAQSFDKRGHSRAHLNLKNTLQLCLIGRTEEEVTPKAKYVKPHPLSEVLLKDVTKAHMREFRKGLLGGVAENAAPRPLLATASSQMKKVIAMLNVAVSHDLVASGAAWKGLPAFQDSTASSDESYRYLTRKERNALIKALPEGESRNLCELLIEIGGRPIEALRLTVADYDKKAGTLALWSLKGRSGNKRTRIIPIAMLPRAVAVLNAQCKDKLPSAKIFNVGYSSFGGNMRDAVANSGVEDASAYCFRHSFITDALNSGIPLNMVAQFTGTSAAMIEKTYAKLLTETMQKAFSKMNAA